MIGGIIFYSNVHLNDSTTILIMTLHKTTLLIMTIRISVNITFNSNYKKTYEIRKVISSKVCVVESS